MCVFFTYIYLERDLLEELAYTIMGTDKSQDLQSCLASWKLRRADIVPVRVQRPENQKSQCFSTSPKAGRLKTQKELMFQFESENRRNSPLFEGRSAFVLYSGLRPIR